MQRALGHCCPSQAKSAELLGGKRCLERARGPQKARNAPLPPPLRTAFPAGSSAAAAAFSLAAIQEFQQRA